MNKEEKPLFADDKPEMGAADADTPEINANEAEQHLAEEMIQAAEQADAEQMEPMEDEAASELKEPKPPSRVGRLAKRALRWTTGLALVLAVGVVLVYALRVRPLAQELGTLRSDVTAAQTRLTSLEEDLSDAQAIAETRKAEAEQALQNAEAAQAALQKSQEHLDLLRVLVDITTAQLALAQDDVLATKAALADTDARLESLHSALDREAAGEVAVLRDRLDLALAEVDDNVFSAERDLQILANNILALEKVLFP